ncbi:hypothetical protein [Kibdelosporangium aridum]
MMAGVGLFWIFVMIPAGVRMRERVAQPKQATEAVWGQASAGEQR